VPEISRFLGISIYMYYKDHTPPHFHALYGDYEITVNIPDGVVQGKFPKRALSAVLEWHTLHQAKLERNWQAARDGQPLETIEPLE
jgi:Domain of unknown function (DUF4160)